MKIVTWNCNGAFRKKFRAVSEFEAHIYVIQECENPKLVDDKEFTDWAAGSLWTGNNDRKGLGIFAGNSVEIKMLDWDARKLEHFITCSVNGDFNLIGTWCHGASLKKFAYIGQLWKYLKLHKAKLGKAVITGDFNSNTFWDKKGRVWNHSEVVRELAVSNINSLYHKHFVENQGAETQPTFYLQKNILKPYHLDYIFASDALCPVIKWFTVGSPEKWLPLSDHMPVVCEF
jgi:exonuclease III